MRLATPVPAIATRFDDAAGGVDLRSAETSFLLCGTLVRFLLPLGLLFQAAAVLAWSAVIVWDAGWRRAVGVFGVAAPLFLGAALLGVPPMLEPHLLLGGPTTIRRRCALPALLIAPRRTQLPLEYSRETAPL